MPPNETPQCEVIRCWTYGASPTGDETIPRLELTTSAPCRYPVSPNDYSTAAHVIASAMWKTLPQGTLDALFAEFARRKASSLSVLYPAHEPEQAAKPTT